MEFEVWLKEKFEEWRKNKLGREGSISAFARYLGVSRDALTGWLAGHQPEEKRYIDALIDKYGKEEVFTAMGLPVPSNDDYLDLGPYTAEEVVEIIQRLAAQYGLEVVIHRDEKSQKGKS